MRLDYLNLTCTDPSRNLAMEQHVFDALPRDRAYFMLWQNDNAIIIGKHQNTLAEINEPYVRAHGIRVVRRLSGGGAVYHDLGNLNFTFIMDAGDTAKLDFHLFCLPVVRTLEGFGVHAEVNGRNDITIEGRKFSGNSQYLREGRVMHHGTILFDSNLGVVADALRVDESKLRAKGIRSVRSRVTNVRPYLPAGVTLAEFRAALLQNILRETTGGEYVPTSTDEEAVDALCAERYGAYEWNYGASPECTLLRRARVEGCGTVEAYLTVERGTIARLAFRGDFFSIDEPEELAERFLGLRPEAEAFRAVLRGIDVSRYFVGMTGEALVSLLTGASDEA